jgi:Trk K+ transport system NAD-binding subunit
MLRQRRRPLEYVGLILGVAAVYTVAFKLGMAAFEGRFLTWFEAFHFVVETFTTTGYGEYAPWTHPAMLLIVDFIDVTGVFLIFLSIPLFVVPWVEERLEADPPSSVEMDDHVVICGFGARGETLASELDSQGVDHVVLESDRTAAKDLHEAGRTVVHGDPESTASLERVDVADARAVVLDESDEENATIALSVDELAPNVHTVCFVEDPALANYLRYAGADSVLNPHEILGRSLADKVTSVVTSQLGDTVAVGEHFEIVEMSIQHDSELDGVTLAESGIRERTGVNVIGAWFAGEFVSGPDPDRTLDRNTILLVSGHESQLQDLKNITLTEGRTQHAERVIVAGYGEVGSTVQAELADESVDVTVVDQRDLPGVDVVGDATEEETLRRAGIESTSAFILALGDDTTTVFSTLVARELGDDVEIICRANEVESVQKLYTAGASYVLSLATVSGRMLAESILGEDVMALGKQIDIVRTDAPEFVGQTIEQADIGSRTGCTVIAVERDGEVTLDVRPDLRLRPDDVLVVAGTDEDITRFNQLAEVSHGGS